MWIQTRCVPPASLVSRALVDQTPRLHALSVAIVWAAAILPIHAAQVVFAQQDQLQTTPVQQDHFAVIQGPFRSVLLGRTAELVPPRQPCVRWVSSALQIHRPHPNVDRATAVEIPLHRSSAL